MKCDAKSMLSEDWSDWMSKNAQPSYRASQVFDWIHRKKVSCFSEMSNIPSQLISELSEQFYLNKINIAKKLVSNRDDTVKYLYTLNDGEQIETVFMKYRFGNSVCISSEVGCLMGCSFCASTKAGLIRRLTASEMLDQVYCTEEDRKEPISHIVIMGIGEPLDNFDELIKFLRIISDRKGRNISLRNITVSTCGLTDKIYRLADLKFPITLAISLHAPNDLLRNRIMPVNKRYSVSEVLKACRYYFGQTGRRITFEYACISGVNDFPKQATELSEKLRGFPCHINLIPVNPISELSYEPSSAKRIQAFAEILNNAGIPVTVRRTLGQDINAACGQLRRTETEKRAKKQKEVISP